jgi:hypothetical protein
MANKQYAIPTPQGTIYINENNNKEYAVPASSYLSPDTGTGSGTTNSTQPNFFLVIPHSPRR